ncbi:neprilysin-1 [Dermacentor silvarum]|uniref:neprilysin-1 n=1 Tax=Dermacentor silvarum TaxID=543639 RepID=UPI002101A071|nr:neprilysin-1 [Dermacentor silvarum]
MHYLPNLRKIITKRKKQKPGRVKLHEPLDFQVESSKASTTSSVAPAAELPRQVDTVSGRLRPRLTRAAAAAVVPEELRNFAEGFPWRRAMYGGVALLVIVGVCGVALFVAWNFPVEQPTCGEDCMQYAKLLNESMDWSVGPCQDFHRFVCGRWKNTTSVRRSITDRFIDAVVDISRRADVQAVGQTVAQKAARLFKSCYDIVTQDTDYVPRIRGYMRDAKLHWPKHPLSRESDSVDVLRSMLELSDKWGWPCLLEFQPELVTESVFQFQRYAIALGTVSSARRTYFETLYSHYGGGVDDGVTFEEMLDYENEIMLPLLSVYYEPRRRYEFQKNFSDTSGVWERWTSAIEEYYDLSGNTQIAIFTTNQLYLEVIIELISTKEVIVELVIGWLAVQFTARFANRQLIASYHNSVEQAEHFHRRACLGISVSLTGIALFLPYLERVYTEPVRDDTGRIARQVRRTVYQTLERVTYPWADLDAVFMYMEISRADDIEARFSHYPDMEASFVKNLRDVIKASRRTDLELIGVMSTLWLFSDDLFHPRITRERHDYSLKPPILVRPMYHVNAPMPVRLGTFGVEVARATLTSYEELQFQGHRADVLEHYQLCFVRAAEKERKEEFNPDWIEKVENAMLYGAAMDVALSLLKLVPSFDEDRLRNVPLTGHQLFYVAHCYTHCGEKDGPTACNLPLRYKEDFAIAFSCPTQSDMRSDEQCRSF